ncbi:MAG: hypothetical protein C0490_01500 [Marivirga sp.]|nr:hypothetical protein [Marivirga sp.]
MIFKKIIRSRYILFVLAILGSCTTLHTLRQVSPHEDYVKGLTESNLITTSMVKSWMAAGNVSRHDSLWITLPFQETGYFAATEPQARFYRFDVKDGQVITITIVLKSKEDARLFADLFTLKEEEWKSLDHVDSTLTLIHEFDKSGSCLVRLQPELLVNMYYAVSLSVTPVLLNPVKGASNNSIGSFYGDPRDGGKRKHEGVDIFAPKGTAIIAPTDGVISKVGINSLGGKIVWMNDLKRQHSYYFAHLDAQYVKAGQKVKQGAVIGTVGTTGNALNTPPHLHFGVYQNTSKDPVTYIRTMERLVNQVAPDTLFQSVVFRVLQNKSPLYSGPSGKLPLMESLNKDNYVKVIAQSNDWYRVVTADEREGFIQRNKIGPAEKGNRFLIKTNALLLSEPKRDAIPVGTLSGSAEGLASYKNFRFVKTQEGLTGWVDLSVL